MYTSYIGKKFISQYNERKEKSHTAESFFEEEFFPLFFDHERHMMHVGNSPFFQKPTEKDVLVSGSKAQAQFANLKAKMEEDEPNMSIYVGFGASDIKGTTSGQITNSTGLTIDKDEMYASWIGQALAVGVSGGFVFLLDDDTILWRLYEGWSYYRKYLEQTPKVKDKQIETWNGNWLNYILSEDYEFHHKNAIPTLKISNVQGKLAIATMQWSEIFYRLSEQFPTEELLIYAYNLSQTNTTLGFIKVFMHEVQSPLEYRKKLIDLGTYKTGDREKDIRTFETFYTFSSACQFGTIGLKALEPRGLRQFMPRGSQKYAQGKDLNFTKEESYYEYKIYQLWIMATLNKIQLLELATDMAGLLLKFEKNDTRGKTINSQKSKEIRESRNSRLFIEHLSHLVADLGEDADTLKSLVTEVLQMPADNFPLFITLIRFEYNYQKTKNNS